VLAAAMTRSPAPPDAHEAELRALIDRSEIDRATELTIRIYGPELIGWLCSILPVEADAHDAFSRMSEELWRSFQRFDGRCSVRTWCYMLARYAASYVRARPRNQREVLVSQVPSLVGAVAHMWNTTRRGEYHAETVYAEIRGQLDDSEQTLLVLRVDRNLAWRDIAIVLLGESADADAVARKAASLRKQFERVKQRLRELAAARLRE
jgi:RNA polymerase sigma-70 factor (ECF subfamily)